MWCNIIVTVGDNAREGMEEALVSYNETVNIDMIAHQVREKGKMAAQKTVIAFRENAKERLAYWLCNDGPLVA